MELDLQLIIISDTHRLILYYIIKTAVQITNGCCQVTFDRHSNRDQDKRNQRNTDNYNKLLITNRNMSTPVYEVNTLNLIIVYSFLHIKKKCMSVQYYVSHTFSFLWFFTNNQ